MLSKLPNSRQGTLLQATLRCRMCARPVGDLVGFPSQPMKDAHFVPVPTGSLPRNDGGTLRCSHCSGTLHLDDVQSLGRAVPLSEVGGLVFGELLQNADTLAVLCVPAPYPPVEVGLESRRQQTYA